ncbi:hypothetical protein NN561_008561 [Cricetulus griseus]
MLLGPSLAFTKTPREESQHRSRAVPLAYSPLPSGSSSSLHNQGSELLSPTLGGFPEWPMQDQGMPPRSTPGPSPPRVPIPGPRHVPREHRTPSASSSSPPRAPTRPLRSAQIGSRRHGNLASRPYRRRPAALHRGDGGAGRGRRARRRYVVSLSQNNQ